MIQRFRHWESGNALRDPVYAWSDVVVLDEDSFAQAKNGGTNSAEMWLIQFYDSSCTKCVAFQSSFKTLAKTYKRIGVNVGAFNCEQNEQLCKEEGVLKYPTFIFYSGRQYGGNLDPSALDEWTLAQVPRDAVTLLTSDGIEGWTMETKNTARAILFTENGIPSAMVGSLARRLKGKVAFAICSGNKEPELARQFGITKMPQLVAITKGDSLERKQKYIGKLVFDEMENFLLLFAAR